MKVVALRGSGNSGKSHTINIAYTLLLDKGYRQIPGAFEERGNPVFEDIRDILELDGYRVGIVGIGDYIIGQDALNFHLQRFVNDGCHAVICAATNKPKIIQAVANFPNHIIINKTAATAGPSQYRFVNYLDAYNLVCNI